MTALKSRTIADCDFDDLGILRNIKRNCPGHVLDRLDPQGLLDAQWAADDAGYIGFLEWMNEGEETAIKAFRQAIAGTLRRARARNRKDKAA